MADDLEQRLRAASDEMRASVDDALHAKVMSRVHAARRERLARSGEVRQRPLPRGLWRLAGLALVATAGLSIWLNGRTESAPVVEAGDPARLQAALASLGESAQPIRDKLLLPFHRADEQIALLKTDAEALGTFIRDQLDVLPSEQRERL